MVKAPGNSKENMTQYLSDKLRILSLISIIFVLYIHSGFHADEIEGMVINDRVQEFMSGMRGGVPTVVLYDFWLSVLSESARGNDLYLW